MCVECQIVRDTVGRGAYREKDKFQGIKTSWSHCRRSNIKLMFFCFWHSRAQNFYVHILNSIIIKMVVYEYLRRICRTHYISYCCYLWKTLFRRYHLPYLLTVCILEECPNVCCCSSIIRNMRPWRHKHNHTVMGKFSLSRYKENYSYLLLLLLYSRNRPDIKLS